MQYELPLKIVSYEVRRAYIVILTGFVFLFFFSIITGTVCFISTCMLIKLVSAFFFFEDIDNIFLTNKFRILWTPTSDWLLISPYIVILESNVKVMRVKEMIPSLRIWLSNKFSLSVLLEIYWWQYGEYDHRQIKLIKVCFFTVWGHKTLICSGRNLVLPIYHGINHWSYDLCLYFLVN